VFLRREKAVILPQNPALTYPSTYPFFQSSDIFYLQFHGIIANKNNFAKVKNIFKKLCFKIRPLCPVAG